MFSFSVFHKNPVCVSLRVLFQFCSTLLQHCQTHNVLHKSVQQNTFHTLVFDVKTRPQQRNSSTLSALCYFLSGPSAGEGWLSGGGVGKLQEGSARLPLHRPAALCQDEEDGCGVSPLYLLFSIQSIKIVYIPQSHLHVRL